jgi:hypothetical protein
MKEMVFQQLTSNERGIREASRLSGYAASSYYYKPKQRIMKKRIDLAILEAIEREALEHPSYGVRRVTAMKRKGMHVNRKYTG